MNKIPITPSTPSKKASAGLGAWDIARFFGAPPLIQGSGAMGSDAKAHFRRRRAARFPRVDLGQRYCLFLLGDSAFAPAQSDLVPGRRA